MKHHKLTLFPTAALAVGALLLLAPNAQAEDPQAKLNPVDTRLIQDEAAAGIALVRIAQLGVKNAERADIKAFAGVIVADHTKSIAEIATLAGSKGVGLTAEFHSKHEDNYENLESENGEEFDKEFLSVIVSRYQKGVENFEEAVENAEDSEVKMWAEKMLTALRAHLEKAKELSSVPTARAGADSGGNTATESAGAARTRRDRDAKTLSQIDQGNRKPDNVITALIRESVQNLEDISANAQAVNISTDEGRVTLRGPVNSEDEKRLIGEIANRIATSGSTDNQLEVRGVETAN